MLNCAILRIPCVLETLGRLLEPGQALCLFQPEAIGVINRLLPHLLILLFAGYIGIGLNCRRRRKCPLLGHKGIDSFLFFAHNVLLRVYLPMSF